MNKKEEEYGIKKLTLDACLLILKAIIFVYDYLTLPIFYLLTNVRQKRDLFGETAIFGIRDNENDNDKSYWKLAYIERRQIEVEEQIELFPNFTSMMSWAFKAHSDLPCYAFRQVLCEKFVKRADSTDSSSNSSPSPNSNSNSNSSHEPTATITSGEESVEGTGAAFARLQRLVRLTGYNWISYGEFDRQVEAASRSFLVTGIRANDKVALYSDTRCEWQIAFHALLRIKAVVVTMYATLGVDGIIHCLNETDVNFVVLQEDKVSKLITLKSKLPNVKKLIFFDKYLRLPARLGGKSDYVISNELELPVNGLEFKRSEQVDGFELEIVSFNRLLLRGTQISNKHKLVIENNYVEAAKDDLALIMYTSGSTGQPKGVEISHKNIMATVKAFSYVTKDFVRYPRDNVGSAYLPLAHIFEFGIEAMMMYHGVRFGFASPHTLTNASPGLLNGETGDLNLLRPTVVIMVPLVLDRIVMGTRAAINSRGYFNSKLIDYLLAYKAEWAKLRYDTPIVNKFVCSKIAQSLGGHVRFIICGSAPLAAETQNYIRFAFNLKLPQGFGTTETCAATTCQLFDDLSVSNVGPPVSGARIKLEPWIEAGYLPSDKPNPRGEILVGGDMISLGYYKLEQATRDAFYDDENSIRWYRTGDIGEFLPNGNLRIIDRKKDLVKLQNGEYVSLGKVEASLKSNPYTDNFCVYLNSNYNYLLALGPGNEVALKRLAKQLVDDFDEQEAQQKALRLRASDDEVKSQIDKLRNILLQQQLQLQQSTQTQTTTTTATTTSADTKNTNSNLLQKLCENELINNHVLNYLTEMARKQKLLTLEIPKKLILLADEWTEDSNLVTAAMKIRRNFIYKRYQDKLDALYRN